MLPIRLKSVKRKLILHKKAQLMFLKTFPKRNESIISLNFSVCFLVKYIYLIQTFVEKGNDNFHINFVWAEENYIKHSN